jgi:hypothetical protein
MRDFLRSPVARLWVPVLALAACVAYLDRGSDPGDLVYFVHKGEQLLSGRWADTFADPLLQSGPVQLVVFGAVRNLTALVFVLELGVAALLLYVLGRLGVGDRLRLSVGMLAVAGGLTHGTFVDGHPAESIVPLLWVLAAVHARENRALRAGALIGLSAGLELWGVLGVPILLLAPRLRRAATGALVVGGMVIAMLLPFALAGSFHMFEHEWHVASGTLIGLLIGPGRHFGWPLRLLQATLALSVGAASALALRRSLQAVWLVPLSVVLVRLTLDPLSFGWYFLEAQALALVGAALLLTGLRSRFPTARSFSAGTRRQTVAAPTAALAKWERD